MHYTNPIVRGFNPDPSVCRVGEDFYLVTSSFAYFPGIPIYHSRDLVNWELIGHCVSRQGLLPYAETDSPGGIWAPTIRYHEGRFYVTATFSRVGNFIVSAENPAGEWSDPIFTEVDGIDPSMYFENGKMYYCTNDSVARRKELNTETEGISLSEMDIATGKVIGERKRIWGGTGGGWLESPHVYKIGEYYYLLCAEGGTGLQHMVTVARSRELFGPYESCPDNPVITNRNDTTKQVVCSGHADLFEDGRGNWWFVHLGCRTNINMHSNIGRESFLLPCTWIGLWPRVVPDGKCRLEMDAPTIAEQKPQKAFIADLNNTKWENEWLFLRERRDKYYVKGNGSLKLMPSEANVDNPSGQPTMALIRQSEMTCELTAKLSYAPESDGDAAGLVVYLDYDFNYKLALTKLNGKTALALVKHIDDIEQTIPLEFDDLNDELTLTISADNRNYHFYANGKELISATTRFMSTDVPDRCFTGTLLGAFAEGAKTLNISSIEYAPN